MVGFCQAAPFFAPSDYGAELSVDFIEQFGRPAGLWLPIDSEKRAYDFSGNRNTGTLNGGVTLSSSAPPGMCGSWKCDGTTGYIVSSTPAMTVVDNWTISACYTPIEITTSRRMLFYIGNGASNGYGLSASSGTFLDTSGNISVLYGGVAWNVTSTPYVVGQPNFVVARRQSGTLTVFLNGIPIGTFAGTPNAPTGSTYIGWDGGNDKAWGNVSQAICFNMALSNAQVLNLYNSMLTGEPYPLLSQSASERFFGNVAAAAGGGPFPWFLDSELSGGFHALGGF